MVTYHAGMDAVFKALADTTRRSLLDALFEEDGQTLSALEQRLPMTRIRRHEAPAGARGRWPDHDEAARAREAPLPEPRSDPARPRPLGEQVRGAVGGRRSPASNDNWRERRWRRCSRSTSRRPRRASGRRSRILSCARSTPSGCASTPTGRPARPTQASTRGRTAPSPRARISRSTRLGASSRASTPSGATT